MTQPDNDPFGAVALDMGCAAVLRIFRALRANGASLVEAAVITGAQNVLSGIVATDRRQKEGEQP